MGRRSTVRRQVVGLVALVLVVGVAVGGWIAGTRVQSSDAAAAKAQAPEPSLITAPVEFRTLSSRVVTRGTVTAGQAVAVNGPVPESGGSVTGVWAQVGQTVKDGDRLLEVSGRPVIVFEGETPAFRSIEPAMTGTDVKQLQAALDRANCDTSADDGVYGSATKECVEKLYDHYGYNTVPTSDTEAKDLADAGDRVGQAEEALTEAETALAEASKGKTDSELLKLEQTVTAAERAVVDTREAGDEARADAAEAVDLAVGSLNEQLANKASKPTDRAKALTELEKAINAAAKADRDATKADVEAGEALTLAEAELADARKPPEVTTQTEAVTKAQNELERATKTLEELEANSGPTVPVGEVVFVEKLPATVNAVRAKVGGSVGGSDGGDQSGNESNADQGLVQLATAALQVRSLVSPSDSSLVQEGMKVELMNDTVSDVVIGATLTSLSDQVVNDGDERGLRAIIEATEEIPRSWTDANVRVTFTNAATDGEVLVVPVAALSSGGDGDARVEVVNADGTLTAVPVDPGLEAEGFVAIEPSGDAELNEGDLVVVGNR